MYFPFLRGKQNELIALRELSEQDNIQRFMRPIIEPVKDNFQPIIRTINELNENNIQPLIVTTPTVGSCAQPPHRITELLHNLDFIPCYILSDRNQDRVITSYTNSPSPKSIYLACGVSRDLRPLSDQSNITLLHNDTPTRALRDVDDFVLINDGFQKLARNADYPSQSPFSELHLSFRDHDSCVGFSDYSIVGKDYSESGGPAFVVTIHISYIDHESYEEMFIRHFSSYSNQTTPAEPAEKFSEALNELIDFINNNPGVISETSAISEFRRLHERQHFPGLGQVKKLAIKHHIQTICDYLAEEEI
ncbi:MAG: sce7725 family protein [Alcanivorax sp.]|nr:sce7725 family protein [Alcanivorax sp.]HIK74724.1 hypothetical protein [Alcanivorax sp.]